MRVALHLGVHKTATTWLQTALQSNIDHLNVAVPELDDLRTNLTCHLFDAQAVGHLFDNARDNAQAYLTGAARAADGLVLSDENILGTPRQLLREEALYPQADLRLQALAAILAPFQVEIYLCLRRTPDFLRALYTEALRNGFYREPRAVAEAFLSTPPDWVGLIDQVRTTFPASSFHVWDYDGFDGATVLSTLIGQAWPDGLLMPTGRLRPSIPGTAVTTLLEIARAQGVDAMRAETRSVLAAPHTDEPYALFSNMEKVYLSEGYHEQLKRLRARHDLNWLA